MRIHALAAAALVLAGCPKKEEAPPASKPAVAEAPGAPARRAGDEAHPPLEGNAEVEFFGSWSKGPVKPAEVVFITQKEPCLPIPGLPTRYGETKLGEEGKLFVEHFIPQGTKGHACLYARDASGSVIATAAHAKNPLTFVGTGEVIFTGVDLTLAPLPPPAGTPPPAAPRPAAPAPPPAAPTP